MPKHPHPSNDQRARAIALYQRGDLTASEIAKQVGVSRATLYNWLNAAGVTGHSLAPPPSPDAEVLARLESLERHVEVLDLELRALRAQMAMKASLPVPARPHRLA